MGFALSKLKRGPTAAAPSEYEKVLEAIEEDIKRLEADIRQARASEKFIRTAILLYAGLAYVSTMLYQFLIRPHITYEPIEPYIWSLFVLTPISIWFARRATAAIYRVRLRKLEHGLAGCRGRKKAKLEELKSMTSYYQTKGVLERFDPELVKPEPKKAEPVLSDKKPAVTTTVMATTTTTKIIAPTWFDRMMDSLMGEDRASKYALICRHCHAHNGLVRPEDLDYTQYTCPNCKLFNPSKLKRPEPSGSAESVHYSPVHCDSKESPMHYKSEDSVHDIMKEPEIFEEADGLHTPMSQVEGRDSSIFDSKIIVGSSDESVHSAPIPQDPINSSSGSGSRRRTRRKQLN